MPGSKFCFSKERNFYSSIEEESGNRDLPASRNEGVDHHQTTDEVFSKQDAISSVVLRKPISTEKQTSEKIKSSTRKLPHDVLVLRLL